MEAGYGFSLRLMPVAADDHLVGLINPSTGGYECYDQRAQAVRPRSG